MNSDHRSTGPRMTNHGITVVVRIPTCYADVADAVAAVEPHLRGMGVTYSVLEARPWRPSDDGPAKR